MVPSGLSVDGSASGRVPGFSGSGTEPGLVTPGHGGGCVTLLGGKKAVPNALPPLKDPPPFFGIRMGIRRGTLETGAAGCRAACPSFALLLG